jgi:hypothetical protein
MFSEPDKGIDENAPPMLQVANPTLEAVVTTTTEAVPTCVMSRLDYCKYQNITVYPNVFGHKNLHEVQEDLVRFR